LFGSPFVVDSPHQDRLHRAELIADCYLQDARGFCDDKLPILLWKLRPTASKVIDLYYH